MWTKGDESSNTMIMNTLNLSFSRPRPWPGLDTQCKKEEEKKDFVNLQSGIRKSMIDSQVC